MFYIFFILVLEKKFFNSSNLPILHIKHPVNFLSNTCNVKQNIAASN